jgi:hypothetical protein
VDDGVGVVVIVGDGVGEGGGAVTAIGPSTGGSVASAEGIAVAVAVGKDVVSVGNGVLVGVSSTSAITCVTVTTTSAGEQPAIKPQNSSTKIHHFRTFIQLPPILYVMTVSPCYPHGRSTIFIQMHQPLLAIFAWVEQDNHAPGRQH